MGRLYNLQFPHVRDWQTFKRVVVRSIWNIWRTVRVKVKGRSVMAAARTTVVTFLKKNEQCSQWVTHRCGRECIPSHIVEETFWEVVELCVWEPKSLKTKRFSTKNRPVGLSKFETYIRQTPALDNISWNNVLVKQWTEDKQIKTNSGLHQHTPCASKHVVW